MKSARKGIVSAVLATFILVGCQTANNFDLKNSDFNSDKANYGNVKLKFNFPEKFLADFAYSKSFGIKSNMQVPLYKYNDSSQKRTSM